MMRTILFMLLVLCAGCRSEKWWAGQCATRFPVVPDTSFVPGTTHYDTAWMPPSVLVFTDTVRVNCDTMEGIVTVPVTQKKTCPPAQVIKERTHDTVRITRPDAAKVAKLSGELQESQRWLLIWRILAGVFAVLFVLSLIFRK